MGTSVAAAASPANVPGLKPPPDPTATLRQQMEAHRANPSCAGCHALMDPIGFGLEGFDAVGRSRTTDVGGFPIDASGKLVDGRTFNGPAELGTLLSTDPRFTQCIARQVFTWAMGRAPTAADECALQTLTQQFNQKGSRLSELFIALVQSDTFTHRQAESP